MSIWNEDSGYYCLLIAIFCDVDVTEAKLIYKYGPGHPVSRRIFRKKLKVEDVEVMEKLLRENIIAFHAELWEQEGSEIIWEKNML